MEIDRCRSYHVSSAGNCTALNICDCLEVRGSETLLEKRAMHFPGEGLYQEAT